MKDELREQMREISYNSMKEINPGVISKLKEMLKSGTKAKQIEKFVSKTYGNGDLTANSTILAAYHMENHPETLLD